MKKILLFVVLLFGNVIFLNAECSYKELKELGILASYIETNYVYNEETGKFDLTILNVPRDLSILSEIKTYNSNGEEIIVNDLNPGSQFKGTVFSGSGTNCGGQNLRTVTVNLPYINPYYGNSKCSGHENLDVCSNRFLDYEISNKTFNSLIAKDNENKKKKEEDNKKDEEVKNEVSFFENAINLLQEIYIPLIIVILTSLVTFGVCSVIYRKMKHGI